MSNPDNPANNESTDNEPEDLIADGAAAENADGSKPAENPATVDLKSVSVNEQLEAAIAERDANRDQILRSQAELENFRRRSSKELADAREYQSLRLVGDILPCLDNLRRALEAAETSKNIEELTQGIQMVSKQFDDILTAHGATPIESVGKPFDPNCHLALTQVPSPDHEPMTVLQEIERGYTLKERIVRPSSVIVSCAPPAPTTDSPAQESDSGAVEPGESNQESN